MKVTIEMEYDKEFNTFRKFFKFLNEPTMLDNHIEEDAPECTKIKVKNVEKQTPTAETVTMLRSATVQPAQLAAQPTTKTTTVIAPESTKELPVSTSAIVSQPAVATAESTTSPSAMPEPAKAKSTHSLDDARALVMQLVPSKRLTVVQNVLKSHGIGKLSDTPPELIDTVYNEIVAEGF